MGAPGQFGLVVLTECLAPGAFEVLKVDLADDAGVGVGPEHQGPRVARHRSMLCLHQVVRRDSWLRPKQIVFTAYTSLSNFDNENLGVLASGSQKSKEKMMPTPINPETNQMSDTKLHKEFEKAKDRSDSNKLKINFELLSKIICLLCFFVKSLTMLKTECN